LSKPVLRHLEQKCHENQGYGKSYGLDEKIVQKNEKKELTGIKFSGILRRSSRETVCMSSGSFFLIFENWSVIKFGAGLEQDLKSLKLKDLTGEFDPGSE
jgi:hypothetical protein